MALRESGYGERPLRIGLLCDREWAFPLLSTGLEQVTAWTYDLVRIGVAPPREPPNWDALLIDASAGLSPRRAVAYFGISAPVVVFVRNSAEILDGSDELDGAQAFVEADASPVRILLTVRTAMSAYRQAHRIRAGAVQVDLLQNALCVGELSVALTAGEARVVGCLARRAGHWCSSKELLRELGTTHETNSPVWQHVGRLRAKLGSLDRIIESNQSLGYRLNPCALANDARCVSADAS
jgi:hypothetical protein